MFVGICHTSPSPALRVAAEQDVREQLGRLMETATQFIQFLLHGEDPLLQLPIGVVPVGAEVAHDHLHLLKSVTRSSANLSCQHEAVNPSGFLISCGCLVIFHLYFNFKSKVKFCTVILRKTVPTVPDLVIFSLYV